MTFDEMIEQGELERVATDDGAADVALEEARLHVRSARVIAGEDPNGAYQLAFDAARKAVMARMRRVGVRVRRGEGGHLVTAKFAAAAIDEDLGRRLEAMRRRRNRSEYGTALLRWEEIDEAITVAAAFIEAAAR